ncbi:HpcH/HpaI aldolase/citrate lyase family protein [Brevibacterium sp. 5221]|uniref:HpcH/HpaI aldolase/citrate lyase family protein n=1 Tax=Brevibacterium rongguiense TaxID=2695267 RepID=A0A6N9H8F7_9MICO|nr:CoA ester lyase [Brevibacterium rongguiense]MYM20161.1 HpcH/HpaI aldolase/citrate lyase family protein [Brevibacterium rongguiense]
MTFEFRPAWLFVPGDRPDRYAKAAERADIVIVDLEDAVAPADKEAARRALADNAASETPLDPDRTVVRVNGADSEHFAADLAALRALPYTHVMLPKAESAAGPRALDGFSVIALIETAKGALGAAEVAAQDSVVGLMWGAEDLIADLGGGSSRGPDGAYRAVATQVRSMALLAGKAHGVYVLDSIWAAIKDLDGLRAEAVDAVESGFDGKVSIHPSHVPVVREAFAPTAEQAAWARGAIAASQGAAGAFQYEGAMIDEPLLKQARRIVERIPADGA